LRIPICCVMLHDTVKAVFFFFFLKMMWFGYPMIQHHFPEEWNPWQHH